MKKTGKITAVVAVLTIVVLLAGIGYYTYQSNHPSYLQLYLGGGSRGDDYYVEHIGISYSTRYNIPLSTTLEENILTLSDWNDEVVTELIAGDYIAPSNVTVYETIKNNKTTYTYTGYVTTQNGETIEYLNEKTFDFVLPVTENKIAE